MTWWLEEIELDRVEVSCENDALLPADREKLLQFGVDRVMVKLRVGTKVASEVVKDNLYVELLGNGSYREYVGTPNHESHVAGIGQDELVEFDAKHVLKFYLQPISHCGSEVAARRYCESLRQSIGQPLQLLYTFVSGHRYPVPVSKWNLGSSGPEDGKRWLVFWLESSKEFAPVGLRIGDSIVNRAQLPLIVTIPPRQYCGVVFAPRIDREKKLVPPAWVKLWGWEVDDV
jgi:hypothetical protein